ncbi:MAG TPA: phosphatase PAP2 family protein [Actinoplanes sp.]|nr:phosphatase PAP2 family protein [Actinoplanes sp.]
MNDKITRSWWPELVALAAFAVLTVALIRGHLLTLDLRVADWALADQSSPAYWTARVFNYLGQGAQVLMPVAAILTFLLWRRVRSIRAALPFAAAFLLTMITIGPAKLYFARAAPRFKGPNREIMFNPDAFGTSARSFPSGHVANAFVWYAVIALLLAALLARNLTHKEKFLVRVLPVAIVLITTIYTGFHWLTDSIAALFLGFVLARLVERIPWDRVPLPLLPNRWSGPAGLP